MEKWRRANLGRFSPHPAGYQANPGGPDPLNPAPSHHGPSLQHPARPSSGDPAGPGSPDPAGPGFTDPGGLSHVSGIQLGRECFIRLGRECFIWLGRDRLHSAGPNRLHSAGPNHQPDQPGGRASIARRPTSRTPGRVARWPDRSYEEETGLHTTRPDHLLHPEPRCRQQTGIFPLQISVPTTPEDKSEGQCDEEKDKVTWLQ